MKTILKDFKNESGVNIKNLNLSGSKNYSLVIKLAGIIGLAGHFMLLIMFFIFGIYDFVIINILSCLVYFMSISLAVNNRSSGTMLLIVSEVIIHSALGVLYFTGKSCFQYYIFLIIPLTFMDPKKKILTKCSLSALYSFIYIILNNINTTPFVVLKNSRLFYMNVVNTISIFICLGLITYMYSRNARKSEGNLLKINGQLERMAYTDPLTGLLNRRSMIREIEDSIIRYEKFNESFIVILTDIDNFKNINDTYGHDCGDVILMKLAAFIRDKLRRNDKVARWGGEEFMILLTNITLKDGKNVAENLRKALREYVVMYDNTPISVTMTFGISEYNNSIDLTTLVNRADQCMYRGKQMGKDTTVI